MSAIAPAELLALRAQTPAVAHHIHLNHASASLPPEAVTQAMEAYLASERTAGPHGAMDAHAAALEAVRGDVAALIGAAPHQIAFVDTATRGWALAVGALVAGGVPRIASVRNEWGANIHNAWLLRDRAGVAVTLSPTDRQGRLSALGLLETAGAGGLIAVPLLPTASGVPNDLERLADGVRQQDGFLAVDAAQAVGQMPVDVRQLGADLLVFPARKWLRGPKGVAVLYVSDRVLDRAGALPMVDLAGTRWDRDDAFSLRTDARRFESFDFSPPARLGLGAAARLARALGPARIAARIQSLVQHLRMCFATRNLPPPFEDPAAAPSGVLTWSLPSRDVTAMAAMLRTEGIWVAAIGRNYARLALADRGVPGVLRIAIHYFNSEAEIEAFAAHAAVLWAA